ncbi:beta-ketoacyl-[acyl-carrier-protein] synthase family protein [Bryobacter aggregatus]|uniref:beta-ketoacyl-[acyl-carrier-protein] synthase family protein n=1 Tax=Bryobacter aggregatus TaxID=360054 RepID=UPI0004E18699|nr:beta-ketoacyl-[acyl-carrier-protein] synthase family protein [Bryobacter aggregatus]
MRRVVVTGLGAVSAFGIGVDLLWSNFTRNACGILPLQSLDTSQLKITTGAEFSSFQPEAHMKKEHLLLADRNAQFALLAAQEAIDQAQLPLPPDAAIVTGCCVGGKHMEDAGYWDVYRESKSRVHPMTIPKVMANAAASLIAMEHGVLGPVFTLSTACSSANHAIGQAMWLVRNGVVEVALTGGSESPFVFGLLKAWEAMRVVSPDVCRPFSKDRRGMSLGEGAGMLLLESEEHARARGAKILGEVAGFGMSADAHHITQPKPEGAAAAMRMALRDAQMDAETIGYVNAHGTGTQANDPAECAALGMVFATHLHKLPVSSTKSMHGHALGAAGALEAVATIEALRRGMLPPTLGFESKDAECDIDMIPNLARPCSAEAALSNSFAFGGLNAVLAFRARA